MQDRGRRIFPAVATVLVHAALMATLHGVRPKPHAVPDENVLPVVWLEREASPPLSVTAPGTVLALPVPPFALTIPDVPLASTPVEIGPLPLADYVGCGLDHALTDEERMRCGRMRLELYARPDVAPNAGNDLALEQRYARDKAVQDHPLLQVCHRRMGPDPLCFSRGYEVLHGSAAARDSVPLPLGDPVRPR